MKSLSAAYYGYGYQDLVTALALAALLRPRAEYQSVTSDHKVVLEDRFDDLELIGQVRRRVQIKAHKAVERPLRLNDFTTDTIRFRIDNAFRSFADDPNAAEEYRLLATFETPDADLLSFLQLDTSSLSLLPGTSTKHYRLNLNGIWPENAQPLWAHLEISQREEFAEFCRRFVIEVECPKASGDLRTPGTLENILITFLRQQIGIGLWPNHNRNLVDVAAHLIYFAQVARSNGLTLNQQDVIEALGLQVDYGRVEERLPVDEDHLVPLTNTLDEILARLANNPRLAITGSPGSGKSWLIYQLSARLRQEGYIVANHYCYISLFDNEISRRASIETTFGSIVAELLDADPSLATNDVPRFAAGPRELEKILSVSGDEGPARRIAIIVDGLDHADRIPDSTKAGTATAIAEELSLLRIPPGVVVLLGSQPGNHLKDFLSLSDEYHVNKWDDTAIQNLVTHMNVREAIRSGGIENDTERILDTIVQKADGNPLYATYLSRTATTLALNQASNIATGDISEYLSSIPVLDEYLDGYYKWLVEGIAQDTGVVWLAELLSLIDFPASAEDIGQIKPEIRHHIGKILSHLAPVLIEDPVHRGIRVYHESFQRYIRDRLDSDPNADIAAILAPAIDWLERKGFYTDLRAFRSLLKLLRRANKDQDVIDKITDDYVAIAAAHGQPADVVANNLAIAGRAAAALQVWPTLSRFVELSRTANYLYQWRLTDHTLVEQYGRAYAALFGAKSLSERLLNERRCTFPARPGLILCRLCDEEGAIAPWIEYRTAHDLERKTDNTSYGGDSNEAISAARLTGRFRLNGLEISVQDCIRWLGSSQSLPLHPYKIGFMLGSMYGTETLNEVIASIPLGEHRAWIRIALAQLLDDTDLAKKEAENSLLDSLPVAAWRVCLSLGANPNLFPRESLNLQDLTAQVLSSDVQFHEEQLSQWLTAVQLAAALDDKVALFGTETRIPTDSWFHRWLRFCIVIAHPKTTGDDIVASLRDLSKNIEVFQGSPRVCDLYSLHSDIQESFREALTKLGENHWSIALDALAQISKRTTTWLMGNSSSPLPLDKLLEICLGLADTKGKRHSLSGLVVMLSPEHRGGEYYDTHAHDHLLLVQLHAASAQTDLAKIAWNKACEYLSGYGWRKDITIFELLDPLAVLGSLDSHRSRKCFHDIQTAVERVLTHTDGKETRNAIHAWLNLAAEFHPAGALAYLAHDSVSNISDPGNLYDAFPKALSSLAGQLNSMHVAAGWLAAGSEARSELDAAFSGCELAINANPEVGRVLWSTVVGALDGDGVNPAEGLKELVAKSAIRLGLSEPEIVFNETKTEQNAGRIGNTYRSAEKKLSQYSLPVLPPEPSSLQIAHAVRQWYDGRGERPELPKVTNAIGWKVIEMIEAGNEVEATTLLERIAHDTPFWERDSLLRDLADGLSRYGQKRLAALMYTFAYTRASDGWRHFAGSKTQELFSRALLLDARLPWSILAEEVAEGIARGGDYGINAHMIELLASNGRIDDAFSAWDASCHVITGRLPATGTYDEIENIYDDKCEVPAHMLASMIVARINSRFIHDKRLAVSGAAIILQHDPSSFSVALKYAITNKAPSSTLITLLHLIELFEQEPYTITKSSVDELVKIAACDLVSARVLAGQLLERAGFAHTLPPPLALPISTTISEDRTTEIIEGIGRKRFQPIDHIWPGFSKYAAAKVDMLLKSETLKEQMQHALRNMNMGRKSHHPEVWYPVDEEIERALQITGASVRSGLAQDGFIDPLSETKVGISLLSNLNIGVRLTLSRIVRPTYIHLPSQLILGHTVSSVEIVPNGDYSGWITLARRETELKIGSGYDKPVEGKIKVFSGVVFTNSWHESDGFPLGYGYSSVWFQNPPQISYSPFQGPLAGLEVVRDPFGGVEVIVPHPIISAIPNLAPSSFDRGLTLSDSYGHKAVVCRTWRRHYLGDEYDIDREPIVEGMQLLIRPDIFDQISALAVEPAKYVTVVSNSSA